jgi:hypothetical protein
VTVYEIGKYILMGVAFALIGYMWLIIILVQSPKGAF